MSVSQKSTIDSNSVVIRFLSCDRYTLLQLYLTQLVSKSSDASSLQLLDATGENWTFEGLAESVDIEQFNHLKILDQIWQELQPHAKEWWELLDIAQRDAFELPAVPGIEEFSRLIFIANHLENHLAKNNSSHLIIILPAGLNGIKLFEMAQLGPIVIEDLLEPILNWWDQTKKSLVALETLMRFKLPSSAKLRFTDRWRHKFECIQQITSKRNMHQLITILDCEGYSYKSISRRICQYSMHAAMPSQLILSDIKSASVLNACQSINSQWMHVTC